MPVRVPARQEKNLAVFQAAIEQIAQGRLNCAGTFTLAAGTTTTTVKAPTVAKGTVISFGMPQTANAAAALATTFILAANVSSGQFIVSHANAGTTDRTFGFIAIG